MPSFKDFNLQPATRAALANMEITKPTPIQAEAIPALLAGNDLVGQSATGSGKILAYGVPLVERLARDKRVVQALVLLPTRDLAVQVHAELGTLASSRRLTTALLVGGRPYANQISALRYGSRIVVGTPVRVKDHFPARRVRSGEEQEGSPALGETRVSIKHMPLQIQGGSAGQPGESPITTRSGDCSLCRSRLVNDTRLY